MKIIFSSKVLKQTMRSKSIFRDRWKLAANYSFIRRGSVSAIFEICKFSLFAFLSFTLVKLEMDLPLSSGTALKYQKTEHSTSF
jgi:hypothetical protein